MDRPVSTIMARKLYTVRCEETIEAAEKLLIVHRISALPVVDARGRTFGILTTSDIARLHAQRKNIRAVRAWEACTHRPLEVQPDTPVSEVARLMVERRLHHMLVTEGGELKGIVSALDFAEQHYLHAARMANLRLVKNAAADDRPDSFMSSRDKEINGRT